MPTWDGRGSVPKLEHEGVHVWLVDLDRDAAEHDALRDLLSPPERARAGAFRFPVHQRRYAVGRGRLRELLAAYLDGDPAAIELVEETNGKPELAAPAGSGLRFNVAHSEGFALVAVARRAVGVDLELVDRPRRPRWAAVAARFFHPDEVALLDGSSGDPGWLEFLRIWTLKEACVKAAGSGLLADTRSFSVAEVLAGRADAATLAGRTWRCAELRPTADPGSVAALAASTAGPAGASRARRARS